MAWSLQFSPLLPPFFLALFIAVVFSLVLFGLLRGRRSAIWRIFAGLALTLILANPILQREIREILPDVAIILVDDSASQSIGKRREQSNEALARLQTQLKSFSNLEVQVIRVAGDGSVDSNGTELFQPLLQSLANIPAERLAGVFMITDGQVQDIPDSEDALPFNAPLHALITGLAQERDRRMILLDAPRFAILGTKQIICYKIEDTGQIDERVLVQVKLDGEQIATRSVSVGETLRQEIEINSAGENVVELNVEKAAGELTALNNRAAATIKGMRENLRVLLISGEPHTGERTWRNLLKSDAAVDLVHFTILRPPDKVDATPVRELSLIAFPVRELFQDKIDDFDLIIFDRYERRNILPMVYFSNMADYTRQGGAILVVSGPEDSGIDSVYQTALADVLPATPTGALTEKAFLPNLSEVGQRHPVTRGLPGWDEKAPRWSRWFRAVNVDVRSGATLMTGPDKQPLLILDKAGEGRVAALLSDQVWLWARNFEGGGPHTDLLRRIVHWLMKEPELEEESLRARQSGDTILIERQSMSQSGTAVQVMRPDGAIETRRLQQSIPGLWHNSVKASLPGLYRITQGDRTALLAVGPANPQEFADVRSTTERLRNFAAASGGSVQRLQDKQSSIMPKLRLVKQGDRTSGAGWAGLLQRHVTDLKGVENFALMQNLAGLLFTLSLLALAWYREGR